MLAAAVRLFPPVSADSPIKSPTKPRHSWRQVLIRMRKPCYLAAIEWPNNCFDVRVSSLALIKKISERILLIRAEKVILDSDLAEFYAVSTKRLNEQVRRNRSRFPD